MTEEQVTHTGEPLREKAFEIYLRHLCENRLNPVFTESEVAVNAMIDFYEKMKNKPTNGYGKESEDHKNSI